MYSSLPSSLEAAQDSTADRKLLVDRAVNRSRVSICLAEVHVFLNSVLVKQIADSGSTAGCVERPTRQFERSKLLQDQNFLAMN